MAKKSKKKLSLVLGAVLIVLTLIYFFVIDKGDIDLTQLFPEITSQEEKNETSTQFPQTTSQTPLGGQWYEVYFTNPKIPFDDIYSGGIEVILIDKINQATSSIDLAVYEFDIEAVAQALINASDRGVIVRVVYDNEFSDPDPQIKKLKSAGISVVPDNRSAFMHNKFFVFDNQCIWTGSFNISMNAAYRNNENAVYFCSPEAAQNYHTEFNEMFAGEFGTTSPQNTPYPSFFLNGIHIENYFAAEDDVMDKIISVISKAQKSIRFMAFSFTDDDLGQEMITKKINGVWVEGIFESTGANTQYSECNTLLKNGIAVYLDGNPRTFHHKVIIIDSQIVIFGSFNFSANANNSNDENLLIVHDANLASAFEQQYQLMKQQAITPSGNTCSK